MSVTQTSKKPLIVDLDGTLTPVDTLHESAIRLFFGAPIKALAILFRRPFGKAHLKAEVAAQSAIDPALLPLNADVVAHIEAARSEGRKVVLCTASHQDVAHRISEHLGLFDKVMASDRTCNLAGPAKAEALVQAYGQGGFDYIGNSSDDLPVWAVARQALVVSNDAELIKRARAIGNVTDVIAVPEATLKVWSKQLRLHQWVKNALIFVPLIAGGKFVDVATIGLLLSTFVAFGILASTTYVLNDLFDLDADRVHKEKRHRPLAAGRISVLRASIFVPIGLAVGLGLASLVSFGVFLVAVAYLMATIAYSAVIKQQTLIDCLWLSGLFTLRIVAGAVTLGHVLSHWLLMFSIFVFLSLAYLKRYSELYQKRGQGEQKIAGRGYRLEDLPIVFALGVGAGYSSVVVLSLYLFSPSALALYGNPYALVVAVPVMIYWISYMWQCAYRGEMHHDPVVFATLDRTSLITIAVFFAVFMLGASLPV